MLATFAPHHNALFLWQVLSLPPQVWRKIDVGISSCYLTPCSPSGSTVLAVAHGSRLDVQRVII